MDLAEFQPAIPLVRTAQRILLVSHIRPDGDAVGSLLGLGSALQEADKQVQMVLADGVPSILRDLPGSDQVRRRAEDPFDLFCTLDCSDLARIGEAVPQGTLPDLNIDHHSTNLEFARVNLVDVNAVSTSEIVCDFLHALGLEVSPPVASALLTGLITDTIGFRTSNMTPRALRLAADLMEQGADLPRLYRQALGNRSFEAARLWGAGLSSLAREGRMVWATLSLTDRKAVNYPGRDDADLVNVLSSIEGADVALIFVEQPGGRVKISWRSRPGLDVSQLALHFGGGGHPAAAGAEMEGHIQDVQTAILEATRLFLNGDGTTQAHHTSQGNL